MGAVFGSGSSQTVFGSSGPGTFFGKVTTVIATIFMLTSLWLSYSATTHKGSIMEGSVKSVVEQTVPKKQKIPQDTKQPAGTTDSADSAGNLNNS